LINTSDQFQLKTMMSLNDLIVIETVHLWSASSRKITDTPSDLTEEHDTR